MNNIQSFSRVDIKKGSGKNIAYISDNYLLGKREITIMEITRHNQN